MQLSTLERLAVITALEHYREFLVSVARGKTPFMEDAQRELALVMMLIDKVKAEVVSE